MIFLYAAFLLLLVVAIAMQLAARRRSRSTGLPAGTLVYSDTGFALGKLAPTRINDEGERQERALVSRKHGLTGRPDYLVRTREGIIPVEAKSARRPASGVPYDSHLMQLAAYCLLVEDQLRVSVPFGLIRYSDGEVRVEYTQGLRETLIELLDEIREAHEADDVHRTHDQRQRCASCGFRDVCDESLARNDE
jgi:CRISPR-associated exonuclease Cas4